MPLLNFKIKKKFFRFYLKLFVFCFHTYSMASYDCVLILSNVDFGTINPYDNIFERTISSIGVKCTNNGSIDYVSYTLTFSAGASGNYSSRLAKSGVKSLAYNIYLDSSYTQILGSGASGTVTFSKNYMLIGKVSQTDYFPIHGKIPVQPVVSVGYYTDNITATLNY